MLSERVLTNLVKGIAKQHLDLHPTDEKFFPGPKPGEKYMLYMHVPFCQVLCPYCASIAIRSASPLRVRISRTCARK